MRRSGVIATVVPICIGLFVAQAAVAARSPVAVTAAPTTSLSVIQLPPDVGTPSDVPGGGPVADSPYQARLASLLPTPAEGYSTFDGGAAFTLVAGVVAVVAPAAGGTVAVLKQIYDCAADEGLFAIRGYYSWSKLAGAVFAIISADRWNSIIDVIVACITPGSAEASGGGPVGFEPCFSTIQFDYTHPDGFPDHYYVMVAGTHTSVCNSLTDPFTGPPFNATTWEF